MSADSELAQPGAAPNDRPGALWSVLRSGTFGLAAAVAGAGLYAAIVIASGYELGLIAGLLGVAVGFAVAGGHAQFAVGWIRALSVVLTRLSLLLSSYLILWLFDGEGFAPLPISIGEAIPIVNDGMVEDPVNC